MQSFGISAFETLDKVLRFSNKLLLLVVCLLLLLAAFLAQLQILAVIDFIVIDTPHRNFDRASRDMIHKSPIVTDHYDRLPVIDQKIFQPLDGLDIEVVGWLVQQKHIRFLQQQFCQFDTHTPTTAELACLTVKVFTGETKP